MSQNIKDQEELLFKEWRSVRPGFIPDGVINEQKYKESSIKVLYILKEVNGGTDWDLRFFLNNAEKGKTWNNIARWQYGIENIHKDISWDNVRFISQDFRKNRFESIAVMNLKKVSGGSSARNNQLWNYSWTDKDFIRRQIKIYQPDIVMCCGTGDIVKELELVCKFNKEDWQNSIHKVKYYVGTSEGKQQFIINFNHPNARLNAKEMLNQLIKTIHEII